MDYPGKVITKNQVTPTQISATGVWTLDDAAAATRNNNWPVAGVPNPISKSLRFNSADSAYLNRTPASAGNRRTFTFNQWIKRAELGTRQVLFSAGSSNGHAVELQADNTLSIYANGAGAAMTLTTTQVFRDPSAWGMLTIAFDTTQATASNRVKIYWNGTQITAFSTATYPSQNADMEFNNNVPHNIGRREISTTFYCGLYMTEINMVDGQQLTPTSFGMTDPVTGVWEPLKYSGTYGTNGFYLNFKDATSTTTLGYDYSGNANNWTTNNFSVTAGAGNDSMTDVPTPWIVYNTTGDVGGVVRGNYATANPLDTNSALLFANGNLDLSNSSGTGVSCRSTFQMPSGKWYWEFTVTNSGTYVGAGIGTNSATTASYVGDSSVSYGYLSHTGNKYNSGAATSYGATFTTNDVIGISFDADAGTLVFYKNGVSQGTAFSSLTGGIYLPMFSCRSGSISVNFGQRPFAYTPPSGFLSLCTTNLPASTVLKGGDYFGILTYTGTAPTPQTITGLDFQPDFSWVKSRGYNVEHVLADVLRGVTYTLSSNLSDAEYNGTTGNITAFNSNGITVGTADRVNRATSMVAWNWKANGAGVSNTAGTITSTVSANTTSGFSIVTYTGNGSSSQTFGHGLGVAPSMVIIKSRNNADQWRVFHSSVSGGNTLTLNTTAAAAAPGFWPSNPSSTVVSIGTDTSVNSNTWTYVAYCFAPISGFSAFGSYTGNGSADGPFVYLGFRPEFVMIKNASATGDWFIYDTARNTYNVADNRLKPNLSDAEGTGGSFGPDILSNGFKMRSSFGEMNGSGNTIIYMAFAENPFKNALAR